MPHTHIATPASHLPPSEQGRLSDDNLPDTLFVESPRLSRAILACPIHRAGESWVMAALLGVRARWRDSRG